MTTVIFHASAGPHAGATFKVREGESLRIGRLPPANQLFPKDDYMSGVHAAVGCSAQKGLLKDLCSRNGTFLNGSRIEGTPLGDGDQILLGKTVLDVFICFTAAERQSVRLSLPEVARTTSEHFYALLDAAQASQVRDLLQGAGGTCRSLYEGATASRLEDVAPYLLELNASSPQLRIFADKSWWGRNWSLYLSSPQPFAVVRTHLRRFLTVTGEEGKQFYFRFYDPRVLLPYLQTCTAEEQQMFFGPVTRYWLEDDSAPFLFSLQPKV